MVALLKRLTSDSLDRVNREFEQRTVVGKFSKSATVLRIEGSPDRAARRMTSFRPTLPVSTPVESEPRAAVWVLVVVVYNPSKGLMAQFTRPTGELAK